MTGVNLDLVKTRAASMREAIEKVRRYAALPDEPFWADERNILSIKLLLIQAIEDATALCAHFVARAGGAAPSGYAECFVALEQVGIVDKRLAARLTGMVRFRNLLVHRYWQVDDRRVLEYARRDIGDLEDYLRAIGTYLSQEI